MWEHLQLQLLLMFLPLSPPAEGYSWTGSCPSDAEQSEQVLEAVPQT